MSIAHGPGFIDVHAHYVTDSSVARARAAGHDLADGMPWATWSVEAHLDLMDRSGIDTAVLSVASPGPHFGDDGAARELARELNEEGARVVRDHPGRFGLFACLPLPDVDGALAEIKYAFDSLDVDGVILKTHTRGVYLGDPRLEPLFAELDRRGAIVLLHPTSPVCSEETALGHPRPVIEFLFDTTRAVTNMLFAGTLERYPRLRVIVPHCGAALPVVADRVNSFLQLFGPDRDSAPDVVAQLRRLYYDTAGFSPLTRQVPALLNLVAPERLLFGSDYCWTPAPVAEIHTATFADTPAPIDGTTWQSLTTANAHRLLPRLVG